MSRRWFLIIPLLILCLLLGACSRIGLVYRNLDVIIPWTLNDYLDMSSEQSSGFKQRLRQHLSWHCNTQLPRYLDWLDHLHLMVQNNQVSDAALQASIDQAKQAITEIAQQITPSTVELLQSLDDQQVTSMKNAFTKDQQKQRERYLTAPLAQQIELRSQRMGKRLNAWLGPLSPSQQQRVQQWAASLGEQNRQWITHRSQWQTQFSKALEQRQNNDFPQRIEQLLVSREASESADYRQAYAHAEHATRSLLVDLMATSSASQRQHLLKKIGRVRNDLAALKCPPEPAPD
ncbi:DUF6279 family lipoprotein [Pseudomonas sp. LD120]|uniref:DUF6279 family lipoprotein n=1 Tax=Pseudomonas sp. LD120 TaxID=485751 RepID=UPI001359A287|nr:DUF6279 family lipoprotein [Pseudomonas sp. LD120]KAF0864710.1 hypothetical protein PLD_22980 [Pseudomonas sp. LD120]